MSFGVIRYDPSTGELWKYFFREGFRPVEPDELVIFETMKRVGIVSRGERLKDGFFSRPILDYARRYSVGGKFLPSLVYVDSVVENFWTAFWITSVHSSTRAEVSGIRDAVDIFPRFAHGLVSYIYGEGVGFFEEGDGEDIHDEGIEGEPHYEGYLYCMQVEFAGERLTIRPLNLWPRLKEDPYESAVRLLGLPKDKTQKLEIPGNVKGITLFTAEQNTIYGIAGYSDHLNLYLDDFIFIYLADSATDGQLLRNPWEAL